MSRIAHLKVTCPQCGKYTSIYVEETGGSNAKVKCEHCKKIFEFSAGMMYEPVSYVPSIPQWAVISRADKEKVFSQAIKCGKCGYEYTEGDSSLHGAFSKTASESDNSISAMVLNSPAFKNLLGVKVLYKCGSCSKIACSECAPESDGITRKKCPFCESDYTIYSEIKPTTESISSGNETNKQQAKAPADSSTEEIPKSIGSVSQEKTVSSSVQYKGIQWYLKVLRQYADFGGRARREEYWMFVLFNMIFAFAWGFVMAFIFALINHGNISEQASYVVGLSYGVLMMLPSMAVAVRRLHDVGKSGWMMLISLIPIVGAIWLFVLMVTEGQQGKNEYGTDPKTSPETFDEPTRLKSAGVTMIVVASVTVALSIFAHIARSIEYNYSVSYHFSYYYLEYIYYILLLITGTILMNEKEIYGKQQQGKGAIMLLLIAVSIFFLLNLQGLVNIIRPRADFNFGKEYVISVLINLISKLTIIFFAVTILFLSQNKDLVRKSAVTVIVFSGLVILRSVYNRMGLNMINNHGFEWIQTTRNLQNTFYVLTPVAYIVLAGTFLSKKGASVVSTTEKLPNQPKLPNTDYSVDNTPATLHIRFSIDAVDGGAYGLACYKNVFKYAPIDALCGCSVSMGDSNATLAGRENVCIIGLTGTTGQLRSIMQALSETPEFKSVCASNPLVLNGAHEPLVADGVYTKDGSRLTSWAKSAFDSLKKDTPLQNLIPPKKEETPKDTGTEKHSTQSKYSLYTGTGVCDVCNNSLSGITAYIVPNNVFYNSSKYRTYIKNGPMAVLMGIPIGDAYFAQMQAQDKSAGSAVCENCIHMFS